MEPTDQAQLAPGGRVPVPDRAVVAAGEDCAVGRRNDHRVDLASVAGMREDLAAGGHVPDPNNWLIPVRRGDREPVRGKGKRTGPGAKAFHPAQVAAAG